MSTGKSERRIDTDVLVIGGGMAGMFAAIKAKELGLDVRRQSRLDRLCRGRHRLLSRVHGTQDAGVAGHHQQAL
jgi:anaerobic glycerol-3-phosphate dehydrogenase